LPDRPSVANDSPAPTAVPGGPADAGRRGPPRDEALADEAQTQRQAPNEESPGVPAAPPA